jgi:hypothetical protein
VEESGEVKGDTIVVPLVVNPCVIVTFYLDTEYCNQTLGYMLVQIN